MSAIGEISPLLLLGGWFLVADLECAVELSRSGSVPAVTTRQRNKSGPLA